MVEEVFGAGVLQEFTLEMHGIPPITLKRFPIPRAPGTQNKTNPGYARWFRKKRAWEKAKQAAANEAQRQKRQIRLEQEVKRELEAKGPVVVPVEPQPSDFKDKPAISFEQSLNWALDNLAFKTIDPKSAPSSRAYFLWQQGQTDPAFARGILSQLTAAEAEAKKKKENVDPEEVEVQREWRKTDRELAEMIRKIARSSGYEPPPNTDSAGQETQPQVGSDARRDDADGADDFRRSVDGQENDTLDLVGTPGATPSG